MCVESDVTKRAAGNRSRWTDSTAHSTYAWQHACLETSMSRHSRRELYAQREKLNIKSRGGFMSLWIICTFQPLTNYRGSYWHILFLSGNENKFRMSVRRQNHVISFGSTKMGMCMLHIYIYICHSNYCMEREIGMLFVTLLL